MKTLPILLASSIFTAVTAQASISVSPITQADLNDLDAADIVWNVQYFPNFNGQMSVGPGLDGDDDFADTTWAVSPSTNSFSFYIDGASNLEATANANTPATDPVTDSFNEIWLFLEVDSTAPDSGDLLEISNMVIGTFSVPTLSVTGGTGFVGQKIRFDDEPLNIGEFSLSGDLTQQFLSADSKDWVVKAIGVQGAVPEPGSYAFLLGIVGLFFACLRRKNR